MIFKSLTIAFGIIAALCLVGAVLRRGRRGPMIWALLAAGTAAVAAHLNVFWVFALGGLTTFWALFTALPFMTRPWRLKMGLTLMFVVVAAISIYPVYHDEIVCAAPDTPDAIDQLPDTCPAVVDRLDAETRETYEQELQSGERGFRKWLLGNVPYRMVRGLDLKGGLRLVYSVDVEEAIRDKRDRYADDIRGELTKAFGFYDGEGSPSSADMEKLDGNVDIVKTGTDTIEVNFEDGSKSHEYINAKFLLPLSNELQLVRSEDGKVVTFRLKNSAESKIREDAVAQAKLTISRRIDVMGLKEVGLSSRDEDIIVEVPRRDKREYEQIRDIISQTARLEFKMVADEPNYFAGVLEKGTDDWPKGLRPDYENAPVGLGPDGKTPRKQANALFFLERLQGENMEDALKRMKAWAGKQEIDEFHEIGYEKVYRPNPETDEQEPWGWRTYYLESKALIRGDMLRSARKQADLSNDSGLGGWAVHIQMDPTGAGIFERTTRDNVQKRFAIILDGKVESAPVILGEIGGGSARITMGGGGMQQQLDDATKLELVLKAGALPAPISPSSQQEVGPSLGEDSIKLGTRAAGIGAVCVLALMLLFYRKAGIIANTAVFLNLVLQITVLSMFNASMTLPGICGLALTIGMSVDANVLINERIKEELGTGKNARAAIATGYEKAFSAILDGNATTFISGIILWQYGTGPIKGFAITLIIGLLTNLFTGVLVTRLLFEWAVRVRGAKLSIGWKPRKEASA